MPLTPEDVSKKRFATARLFREGYDMTEVDEFLDQIEVELGRLFRENEELRQQLAQVESASARPAGGESLSAQPESAEPRATSARAAGEEAGGSTPTSTSTPGDDAGAGAADPGADAEGREIRVTTTEEASAAVARMVELAGKNAEDILADARRRAEEVLAQAREEAGEVEAQARREHDDLVSEVENLRAFEREYRAQLRSYFEQQLEALDADGDGSLAEPIALSAADEDAISARLASLLSDDDSAAESSVDTAAEIRADGAAETPSATDGETTDQEPAQPSDAEERPAPPAS